MEETNNITDKLEEKLVIVNDDEEKQRTYEITQTDHLNAKLLSIIKEIPPQFMQNDDDSDDDFVSDDDE